MNLFGDSDYLEKLSLKGDPLERLEKVVDFECFRPTLNRIFKGTSNNINRFLQQANPNPTIVWGVHQYKVGDPILFNDSKRFAPLIYNNLKGWIIGINLFEDESGSEIIEFDIEVDKIINGLEAEGASFELLENSINGNSVIRFSVNKYKNTDDDDYLPSNEAPFQIAYAVSIHKAQGLEYSSVKLVVADEVEDMITHSIFYTAITRTRDKLRIYWTPETQNKILSNIKPIENSTDVALLRFRINNLNK